MAEIYDLIVIGGGPGGYVSAVTAAKKNKKVVLFEIKSLGGTCLNTGCIPTKYLLDKSKTMEKIIALTEQGIFKDAGLFSFKKIQEGKTQIIRKLVDDLASLLKAHKVNVVQGLAELKSACVVICNGIEYWAKDVIIATGSQAVTLPLPGAEYAIDSTSALTLESPPARMVIIGGGVIGMELASAYQAFGTAVTVVEMQDELFPGEEKKLVNLLTAALRKRGIRITTGVNVTNIKKTQDGLELQYSEAGAQHAVQADAVLAAAGRKPNLQGIDTKKLAIEINQKGELIVDEHMQTSLPHVYAIGDVIGGYQLAHAAYAEGECAVHNILEADKKLDLTAMPRCIYTLPSYAAVGMTSQKATEAGYEVTTGSFSYTANGMALAEGATGMILVVADRKTTETLGIHLLGDGAPELVSVATVAVACKMTLPQWEKLIIAHPTLSEMLREAALDCFGAATHKL